MKPNILYVEDDVALAFVTKDNLELEGFNVVHVEEGETALTSFRNQSFDLCLLDVMLPEMDGFSLAGHIRRLSPNIPILFLTAKSLKEDRIAGLTLGADDYITKPFSIEELVLRIKIFLRRSQSTISRNNEELDFGDSKLKYSDLQLISSAEVRQLTQREADVLRFFVVNKNMVIKREEILKAIWGDDDYFYGRSLDVFISRLRKYLKPDEGLKIENIHGVGFRLKC